MWKILLATVVDGHEITPSEHTSNIDTEVRENDALISVTDANTISQNPQQTTEHKLVDTDKETNTEIDTDTDIKTVPIITVDECKERSSNQRVIHETDQQHYISTTHAHQPSSLCDTKQSPTCSHSNSHTHTHSHSNSKAHQRQLVKELATKLHHLEAIVQLELPALQQQLTEQEQQSTAFCKTLTLSHEEEIKNLKNEIQQVHKENKTLTQSVLKTNLRNTHISQEYQNLLDSQVSKDREIKILKESIVDLRTVMTRLPSSQNNTTNNNTTHTLSSSGVVNQYHNQNKHDTTTTTTSPDDSQNNRTAYRLLKRKMGSGESEAAMVKTPLSIPISASLPASGSASQQDNKEGGKKATTLIRNNKQQHTTMAGGAGTTGSGSSGGVFSQQLLDEAETQIHSLKCIISKQRDEIVHLKQSSTSGHECSYSHITQGTHHHGDSKHSSSSRQSNSDNDSDNGSGISFGSAYSSNTCTNLVLSPSRPGRHHLAATHNHNHNHNHHEKEESTTTITASAVVIKKKNKQIDYYRQKLAESYEEREQEKMESKETLRFLTKKLDSLNLVFLGSGNQQQEQQQQQQEREREQEKSHQQGQSQSQGVNRYNEIKENDKFCRNRSSLYR